MELRSGQRKDSTLAAGEEKGEAITAETFCLFLKEALLMPDLQQALRDALRPQSLETVEKMDANMATRMKLMEEELAKRDAEIIKLKGRVDELEGRLDDQEQYSRRTSVRISGVEEEDGEDIEQTVNEIFATLDHRPAINRVHRVGAKLTKSDDGKGGATTIVRKGPRQIICQFTNYPDKRKTLKLKADLKDKLPGVFFNDDLTRQRSNLFFQAREKKRNDKINDCWTADGRIVIKDKQDKIHYITRLSDLKW